MIETSADGKDNEGTQDSSAEEPKKKPDLDDTLSRLLRRKADVDAEESEGEDATD
tara:strand:+ start:1161 stop:1325 length:165 start_codon:yes stop_codon:yes gene_type:complete